MAFSVRTVLAAVMLALLATPALAAPTVGSGSGCVAKGGPYQRDCQGKCCNPYRCSYTSVGGGYFCT
jgi:hypothetical protein